MLISAIKYAIAARAVVIKYSLESEVDWIRFSCKGQASVFFLVLLGSVYTAICMSQFSGCIRASLFSNEFITRTIVPPSYTLGTGEHIFNFQGLNIRGKMCAEGFLEA